MLFFIAALNEVLALFLMLMFNHSAYGQETPSAQPTSFTTVTAQIAVITVVAQTSKASTIAEYLPEDNFDLKEREENMIPYPLMDAIVHDCYNNTAAALQRWRTNCKQDVTAKSCWSRAPRLDRCCEKDDVSKYLAKPYWTCKSKKFIPKDAYSWDYYGGYCFAANGRMVKVFPFEERRELGFEPGIECLEYRGEGGGRLWPPGTKVGSQEIRNAAAWMGGLQEPRPSAHHLTYDRVKR